MAGIFSLRHGWKALRWAAAFASILVLSVLVLAAFALLRLVLLPIQHLALTVVAVAIALEAMLATRVFLQLAYQSQIEGLGGSVLNLTDSLVSPFRTFEGITPIRETGVVEFATLTAMEAYLIAALVAVLLLSFWSELLHMFRRVNAFFGRRAERRISSTEAPVQEQDVTVSNAPVT